MENADVSKDDLLDVLELTQKLENQIGYVLKENELPIAMSALISSTINCMVGQCNTIEEVVYYRNLYAEIFDGAIRAIKIKQKE
jgi:hypothetical protein